MKINFFRSPVAIMHLACNFSWDSEAARQNMLQLHISNDTKNIAKIETNKSAQAWNIFIVFWIFCADC